ncbi:unnamed protein product [[Candida] boidinii]|nr:unnamed protein product [[Candida] boidinii]
MVSLFKKKNKISKSSNNGSSPLQLNRKSSLNDLNNHNTNNTDNADNNTNQIGHKSSYSSGSSSNSTKFSSNIPITPRLPNSLPTPGTSLSTPNHENIMNAMTNNNNDEYSPMIVNNIVSSNPTTPNFVPSFVTNLKDSGASTKFTNINNNNNNDNINTNNNSKDHSHHSQRQHQQPSQMNQGHQRKVSVASYYTTPPQTSDSQDQQKQHPLPKQIRLDPTNNDQYQQSQQPIQQQYYQSSTNNIPPPINNNSTPSKNNNPDQIPIYSPVTVTSQNNINNNMNSLASTPTKSQTPLQIPQQQRQQSSSNQLSKQKSQQFEQYHKEQLQNSPQQRLFVNTPWKKKKLYNSPFPRFSHAASASTSESGAFYLMGGLCGKHVYGDMWIIEPVKNDKTLPSDDYSYIASPIENFDRVPAPRIGHSAVLIGNAFIVFAGDTVTNASQILDNKLYFFNITSLKWTITSPEGARPIGRYGHKISVLNFEAPIPQDELDESDNNNNSTTRWSSYLYVFGGQLEDELFNDIWKFDLSNFRNPKTHWQKIQIDESFSYVPPKLTNHSMIAYDDKLYIYGGTDGRKISDKLICFDASNEIFIDCKLKGDFKPPALEEHTCTLYQNLMFVYGGRDSLNNSTDILFCIDLNTFECFKVLSGLFNSPGKRCGHSITVDLLNEKLIVMGGDQQDNDLTNVSEMTNVTIDVSNLNYPTTVIYEFDLNLLTKYMDRSNNVNKQQQQLQRQIYQEDNNNELSSRVTPNKTEANGNNATDQLKLPSTISDPAVAATSDVTSPLKHMSSLRRGKGKEDDEIDDNEEEEDDFEQAVGVKSKGHVVSKSINDQDSQYYKSGIAPKRISQYAVFENISDDDVARINDEQPLISSTPLKKVDPGEIEDEEEVEDGVGLVPNEITSKLSNATRHPIKSAGPLNSDLINDNNDNDNDNDNTNAII